MKVAITGASGYIGRHVVSRATELGYDVLGVCYPQPPKEVTPANVQLETLDILEASQEEVSRVFEKQDACLHLAWQAGFNHQDPSHIANVLKHYYFIEKLIKAGVKNISIAGTMHEIGYHVGEVTAITPCNPINPYGIAKNFLRQAVSVLCEKNNVTLKWLRMFYIVGDDEKSNSIFGKILAAEARGDARFPLNSGEMLYDFISIGELAVQLTDAATQTDVSGIINCCSGKPISLRNAVESFITKNQLKICPEYNVFPHRPYDSYAIWGETRTIQSILKYNTDLSAGAV